MFRPALALSSVAVFSLFGPATGGTKTGVPCPPAPCAPPTKIVIEQCPPEVTFAPAPACNVRAPGPSGGVQCFPFSIPGPPQVVPLPGAFAPAPMAFAPTYAPAPMAFAPTPMAYPAPAAPVSYAPAPMGYAPTYAPAPVGYAPAPAPMAFAPAPMGYAPAAPVGFAPPGFAPAHPAHAPNLSAFAPAAAGHSDCEHRAPSAESLRAAQQAFNRVLEEKELQREHAAIAERQQAVSQRLYGLGALAPQSPPGQAAPHSPSSPPAAAPKKPENLQDELDSLKAELKKARELIDLMEKELKKPR